MPKAKDLHALNEEAWAIRARERSRAHELVTEVLQLAKESGNRNEAMQARVTLASIANFRMELDLAEKLLEEVEVHLREDSPRPIIVRYMHQRCYLHHQRAEFQDVLKAGQAMLDYIDNKGLLDEQGWVLTTMGIAHQRLAQSHLALNSYREAEKVFIKLDNKAELSNAKMCIGVALTELEKNAEALVMLEESLNLRLSVGGEGFQAGMIVGNMAKAHHQLGDHNKALQCWSEAIDLLLKAGGMPYWAFCVAGRADTLLALGRLEEAEADLNEVIEQSEKIPAQVLITVKTALARVHVDSSRWEEALHTLREVEALITDVTDHCQLFSLYKLFHQVFKALGLTAEALEHHERMYFHRERHLNELSLKRLAEWEALYNLQDTRERDRKLLEKTQAMQEQLADVSSERDALLTRNARCDTLMDEMLGMIPSKSKGRMERLIRNAQKMEKDQTSDSLLMGRIAEAHPTLTHAELQACVSIARGWSSKEMADQSGVSIKAMEKHRTSIRKKASIPQSVSLRTYLARLGRLV